MWNLDLYARLDLADAWAIIGPVNWYAPTSNLKAMFDRLVCMNGGNPREDLIGHKDPERAIQLEHSPEWEALSRNHLEGRTAGFFCYGDGGGDELDADGAPEDPAPPRTSSIPAQRAVRRHARRVRAAGLAVPVQRDRGARCALALRRVRPREEVQRQPGRAPGGRNRGVLARSTTGPTRFAAHVGGRARSSRASTARSATAPRRT